MNTNTFGSGVVAWRKLVGGIVSLLCVLGFLTAISSARAEDVPAINKTSIIVDPWQLQGYWAPGAKEADFKTSSWIPRVKFTVLGPVPGGSQISVEFTRPDGSSWMHLNCPTTEIKEGATDDLETEHHDADERKGVKAVGVYGFTIRYRNELTSQNQVLYAGKFTVGKVDKSNGAPAFKNKFDFYVDHDWLLPFGYIWFRYDLDTTMPQLAVGSWIKGNLNPGGIAAYLFYKGKQVASTKESGGGGDNQLEIRTASNGDHDPRWVFWTFNWRVRLSDPTAADGGASRYADTYFIDKNPGEYEVKVLAGGKVCRSVKFKVGDDGKIVDPGFVAGNKLGTRRILVPAQVIGTVDGEWNRTAWKTDAFYGHPLSGFIAP